MKTTKLCIALLILGWGGSNALLRGQDTPPDQQQKQVQDLSQQQKEDRQQIEQLKQRLDATDKKLGDAQKAVTETQKQAADAQKAATEAAAKIQPVEPVASEEATATRNLTIAGGADVLFQKNSGDKGNFTLGHFNPVLLYRAGDHVLAEAEMEMKVTDNGDTELGLEYAQIDYLVNDYLTLIAGRFVLPIGVVREKLDAGWINKLPIQPLPEADATALIPENDIGVQARGALPLSGPLRLTYAAYVVNGPGEDDATNIMFNAGANFNKNPSEGGRLALFVPWEAHHDIEIGVSGQTGRWNHDGDLQWSVAAVDAALHFNEYTEFRGEYLKTWQQTDTEGTLDKEGWWAQVAYKLAGLNLDLPVINDFEAVFRYSGLQLPDGHANQFTPGLNYYINNTFIVKAACAFGKSNTVDADGNSLDQTQLLVQVAYGF